MSCTVCGSSVPCRCNTANCDPLSSCGSSSASGCCQNTIQATPQPFYSCAPSCVESHTQRVILQQFYTTVEIANSWNVPGCGESAILTVVGLKSVAIGSYLWNQTYGYFEITAFDSSTGQVTVVNHCNDGNAAVGTNVPSCTEFAVTDPPCECPGDDQVCVAIDFTAPDVDDCIDITLTSTEGLTASDTIQIGSGFYFLEEIKPNDVVTICNHGDGITPGTSVIAKDANDNYQYCISVISTNPCDRVAEKEVIVLGCGEDGVTVPLNAENGGWVVTALNDVSDEAAYRPLGADDNACTTLTSAFTILAGITAYTNVAVSSSAGFAVGDVLEIEGGAGYRFLITNIPNATHIDFTSAPVTVDNVSFPNGSVLCLQNCCDTNAEKLAALPFLGQAESFSDAGPFATVTELNPTVDGTNNTFTIVNPSATKAMYVNLVMTARIAGTAGADLSPPGAWPFEGNLVYTINGGAPAIVGYAYTGFGSAAGESLDPQSMDFQVIVPQLQTVPAGATYTFTIKGRVNWLSAGVGGTNSYYPNVMIVGYTALGIPVP